MADIELTFENISNEFEKDVTWDKASAGSHLMKMGKIFKKWVTLKYDIQNVYDESFEREKQLVVKLEREYTNGTRSFVNQAITKYNVKEFLVYDPEYIKFKAKQKELEQILEAITLYYLSYLSSESFKIKEFNEWSKWN